MVLVGGSSGLGGRLFLVLALIIWVATGVHAQVSPGPLAKAHQSLEGALNCTKCHAGGGVTMESRCIACHGDIGWLQARSRGIHGTPPSKAARCASCHPDHAGVDFALIQWPEGSKEKFDHRRAGWGLEKSHAQIECATCHQPEYRVSPAAKLASNSRSNWTGLEQSCASCHEDAHKGVFGERCQSCHDAGEWKLTPGFKHDTTSYPLTGRHVQTRCTECHTAPNQRLAFASCASCHQDPHTGSFGANCTTCHNTRSFSEISGAGFDHARTTFPLKGKHATVTCASCHKDFTTERGRHPAATTCAACHAPDRHAGTATIQGKPADCAGCHDERGFSPGAFSVARHRQSAYPLEEKHTAVRCSACHKKEPPAQAAGLGTARVVLRPVFAACTSCHADRHGGQLAAKPNKGECAECHAVAGWTPSRFDQAAHAKLRLPLDGKHAEISCGACHGEKKFLFAIESRCSKCHTDPHNARYPDARCTECHSTSAFKPAAVDAEAHNKFRFALRGAHRATPCSGCHKDMKTFVADTTCATCHQTVHGNQFVGRRCDACHAEDSFKPASRFDHDKDASFALGKGHQKVACSACHKTEGTPPRVVYKPLSGKCEDCHKGR